MNFDWPQLIVGLIFSCVGFVYFSYGKRTQTFQIMICGLALMTYSYFVDSMTATIIVGLVLSALPFLLKWW